MCKQGKRRDLPEKKPQSETVLVPCGGLPYPGLPMFSLRIVTVDHYLAAPVPRLDPGFSRLGGWEVWKVPVIRIFGVTSGDPGLPMFSLRIVTVDHYLAAPVPRLDPGFSRLGGWEVWKVPVIRIFGVTSGGQKACLHVHGVFPYLCVPFDEDSGERADKFAPMLASELDLLLNTAAGRAASRQRHVHHVEAFRGTPLYGFHNKERTFLKIYLYNPYSVKKVADLLLSGMVLKKVMQPHEAHIPFALQAGSSVPFGTWLSF
ncbi:DNA polymerase zeta catalytic subunit [Ixodes scapularis]